ncbi:MAG: hypothetical protein PWP37_925 [Thermotogota bacterium]|nr:hypothetical protein [Thermotogota bacterium]MDK2864733.1 hypothetical protein [Thermotogota bacterium]HCZ06478.1 FAD-dependent oxidoreductase [Thermotogota bacterium]
MRDKSIVIIGGGIIGASIAYHLAIMGAKNVVLFEKNYVSSGATGRCGGGIRQQWSARGNVRLAMRSVRKFETFKQELGWDIEYRQGGYLLLAYTEEEAESFENNVKMQREEGLHVEILTPESIKRRFPYVNTTGVLLGTFCPTDGHANPHLANFAYIQRARELGVEVYTHTEVTVVETSSNRVTGIQTKRGYLKCDVLVNASGAWSKDVANMAGSDLPTESYRHQILVTEPVENFMTPLIMSFSKNFYIRQTLHGSFLMGQGDPDEKPGINYRTTLRFEKEIATKLTTVLPFLRNMRIVRHWSGHYNMSPDAQPIIGRDRNVENLFHAVGFSGHGFMLAPAVGEALAEMILTGKTSHIDLSDFDMNRFERKLVKEKNVV